MLFRTALALVEVHGIDSDPFPFCVSNQYSTSTGRVLVDMLVSMIEVYNSGWCALLQLEHLCSNVMLGMQ
jgi:hypothetical protein